ncbi:MAG: hypothetical protein HOE90_17625 [Bacteriovoracaceae bacterium]|jgi:hypothetical protein|nr:hypothetical protein [Bacteriovoracaceae bacterium]
MKNLLPTTVLLSVILFSGCNSGGGGSAGARGGTSTQPPIVAAPEPHPHISKIEWDIAPKAELFEGVEIVTNFSVAPSAELKLDQELIEIVNEIYVDDNKVSDSLYLSDLSSESKIKGRISSNHKLSQKSDLLEDVIEFPILPDLKVLGITNDGKFLNLSIINESTSDVNYHLDSSEFKIKLFVNFEILDGKHMGSYLPSEYLIESAPIKIPAPQEVVEIKFSKFPLKDLAALFSSNDQAIESLSVHVVVDPDGEIFEFNKENNRGSFDVTLFEAIEKYDLKITSSGQNESYLNLTITNEGFASSPELIIQTSGDESFSNHQRVDSIPAIAPGASKIVSIRIDQLELEEGIQNLISVIQPHQSAEEYQDDNNSIISQVEITAESSFTSDLKASGFVIDSRNGTISLSIQNLSPEAIEGVSYKIVTQSGGELIYASNAAQPLAPQQVFNKELTFSELGLKYRYGQYMLYLIVDQDDAIHESDEKNNKRVAQVNYSEPDLQLLYTYDLGQSLIIYYKLKGGLNSYFIKPLIEVYAQGSGDRHLIKTISPGNVNGNNTAALSVWMSELIDNLDGLFFDEEVFLIFKVSGIEGETNLSNNEYTRNVPIFVRQRKVDFAVSGLKIEDESVKFKIENIGDLDYIAQGESDIQVILEAAGVIKMASLPVAGLNIGESQQYSYDLSEFNLDYESAYKFSVNMDFLIELAEDNQSNNSQTISYTTPARPLPEFELSSLNVSSYSDRTTFSVTSTNSCESCEDVTIQISAYDSSKKLIGRIDKTISQQGGDLSVYDSELSLDKKAPYDLSFVIDPGKLISELSEENNLYNSTRTPKYLYDLSVLSLTFDKTSEVMSALIENKGVNQLSSYSVTLTYNGQNVVMSSPRALSSLAPGEKLLVGYQLSSDQQIAVYGGSFEFTTNAASDGDSTDNQLTHENVYTPQIVDLAFGEITLSPEGSTVEVQNLEMVCPSGCPSASFKIFEVGENLEQLRSHQIDFTLDQLGPGHTFNISPANFRIDYKRDQNIKIVLDPTNSLEETSEENNISNSSIHPKYGYDLSISNFNFNSETGLFSATVKNEGSAPTNNFAVRIKRQAINESHYLHIDQNQGPLAPGEELVVRKSMGSINWSSLLDGDVTISARVYKYYYDQSTTEGDGEDNEVFETFTFVAPDLHLISAEFDGENRKVRFSYQLTRGTLSGRDRFEAKITLENSDDNDYTIVNLPLPQDGEIKTHEVTDGVWTALVDKLGSNESSASSSFKVQLDYFDRFPEINEDNNEIFQEQINIPQLRSNLFVSTHEIEGETLKVFVKNGGDASADVSFTRSIILWAILADGTQISKTVGVREALPPTTWGNGVEVRFSLYELGFEIGIDNPVLFIVDPVNAYVEHNEVDNIYNTNINFSEVGIPDLTITDVVVDDLVVKLTYEYSGEANGLARGTKFKIDLNIGGHTYTREHTFRVYDLYKEFISIPISELDTIRGQTVQVSASIDTQNTIGEGAEGETNNDFSKSLSIPAEGVADFKIEDIKLNFKGMNGEILVLVKNIGTEPGRDDRGYRPNIYISIPQTGITRSSSGIFSTPSPERGFVYKINLDLGIEDLVNAQGEAMDITVEASINTDGRMVENNIQNNNLTRTIKFFPTNGSIPFDYLCAKNATPLAPVMDHNWGALRLSFSYAGDCPMEVNDQNMVYSAVMNGSARYGNGFRVYPGNTYESFVPIERIRNLNGDVPTTINLNFDYFRRAGETDVSDNEATYNEGDYQVIPFSLE